MTIPKPAETVVYRHPCDCPSASRPLAEGEEPEHRFDVEGNIFPWLLPEKPRPVFTRLLDDLWRVDVTLFGILGVSQGEGKPPKPRFTDDPPFADQSLPGMPTVPGQPVIAGAVFPWRLTGNGVIYWRSHKTLPMIMLGFFARDVDTDTEVVDQRHIDQTIVDNDGALYHESERDRLLWEKARETTKDWPQPEYDENNPALMRRGPSYDMSRQNEGIIVAIHPDDGSRMEVTL